MLRTHSLSQYRRSHFRTLIKCAPLVASALLAACSGNRFDGPGGSDSPVRVSPAGSDPAGTSDTRHAAELVGTGPELRDAGGDTSITATKPGTGSNTPRPKKGAVSESGDLGADGGPASEPAEAGASTSDHPAPPPPPRADASDDRAPSDPDAGAQSVESVDECSDPSNSSDPCGCGDARDQVCASFGRHLIHRYSFSGTGSVATDTAGGADGTIVGTQLDGSGILPLNNTANHVELPAGIVSRLEDATLEAWLTWSGDGEWQRIFDFGGLSDWGDPQSYIFLSPHTRGTPPGLTLSFSTNDSDNAGYVRLEDSLPSNTAAHVAVVVDGNSRKATLFVDGEFQKDGVMYLPLSAINDEYNTLGRSLFGDDPDFHGSFDEFRIYDAALSADEVSLSFERGPDAALDWAARTQQEPVASPDTSAPTWPPFAPR